MIRYLQKLGYQFESINEKEEEIKFKNLVVYFSSNTIYTTIAFPTKHLLNQFKSKLDFSKINGKFKENAHPEEGYRFMIRSEYD
jgi:hypothetical protein